MMKIDSLQYLRAIAAIWVLITHVFQICEYHPFGYMLAGQYGVDVFFILSGFIIYYTTKEDSSWVTFAIKRIFRIFPLYWVCLLAYWIRDGCSDISWLSVIQNILMMPFSDRVTTRSLIVGQAWSTCYELYFYFLFSVVLFLGVKKHRLPLFIIFLMFTGIVLKKIGILTEYGFMKYLYSLTTPISYLLKFVIGTILAMVFNRLQYFVNQQVIWGGVFAILPFGMLFQYKYSSLTLLYSSLLFLVALLSNESLKRNANKTFHKIMVYLGDISFSIYLIHLLVISIVVKYIGTSNVLLVLSITLVLSVGISIITYNCIEKNAIGMGKSLIANLRSKK